MEPKFVVDIVVSLTVEELINFRKASETLGQPVHVIMRQCMNEGCKELLKIHGRDTEERTETENVSEQTS
jgi:hypothetical protein